MENDLITGLGSYLVDSYFWLGEIYLLEQDYSKAVLIYAEGYQKFPKSFHAPITLVQMSEALIRLDKLNEACKTLNIVAKDFSNDERLVCNQFVLELFLISKLKVEVVISRL